MISEKILQQINKKRILFVDDEPNILQGLNRILYTVRHEWDIDLVDSGHKALELLEQQPFDVVVTDMRMPDMNGAELLERIKLKYPQVVRIVLSGHSDRETVLRSIGPTHQYLSKPCEASELKATIARACALRELLADNKLKMTISRMNSLPSLPDLYVQIVEELQGPEASLKKMGEIISNDVGMSAKILQLVNSAFFGMRQNIADPIQAAVYLGLDTIKTLVLTVKIFAAFKNKSVPRFSIEKLWNHSLAVGACAKQIAKKEGADERVVDEAFMGGVLHDAGKLVFLSNLPQKYNEVLRISQEKKMPVQYAEEEVYAKSHAHVGAYLLGLWGLPDAIVETLAYHHMPNEYLCDTFSSHTAVYLANQFLNEIDANHNNSVFAEIDMSYLERIGIIDRLEELREACFKIYEEGVA